MLPFLSFAIPFVAYVSTAEPTVSLWDCGEFIASAAGLQIGHPPGAPLYAMAARMFASLAPSEAQVAFLINLFSAVASAFTILFLYKSIALLFEITARHAVSSTWIYRLAAFAAALTFAFTDTFWFSAVEAEVYALSSLFTAICFWAGLKWYASENGNINSRWLILIAYLCGLSYGVHLLNLLIIPAISYLVITRCYPMNLGRRLLAVLASSLAVGVVMYFFVPAILWFLSHVELVFVNSFGLAYNSGTLTATALLFGALIFSIWFTYRRRWAKAFTLAVCFSLFTLGFASYAMVLIRGTQNPPMNQNQVDNIFSLKSYLDRDQYGKTPLLYGPYYSAPVKAVSTDQAIYVKVNGTYRVKGYTLKQHYYGSHCTLFPRMFSNNPSFTDSYRSWAGIGVEDSVAYKTADGKILKAIKPTFVQNLTYFAGYQLWWMYFRYFLWNFSGRQNDIPGHGNILRGNWISGFPVIDNLMLGPQDELPQSLQNNKANNRYFLIPLLLGIIGLVYQSHTNKDVFITTLLLFFFTGIAIVVFLNQVPIQARERDYAYVGSFYVFAIWIGYGFLQLALWLKRLTGKKRIPVLSILFLAVPALVLAQNFDDHNRSNRHIARSYAQNYLKTAPRNSLLIVYGDNDTFPLWYLQMVEGIRQDVKVFNSNYLFTNWNPGQLAEKTYTNDAFKLQGEPYYVFPDEIRYAIGTDSSMAPVPLRIAMLQLLTSDMDNKIPSPFRKNIMVRYLPQDVIILPGLSSSDSSNIFLRHHQVIPKDQIIYLDLINQNYPERTISFAQTVPNRAYSILADNLLRVGLSYELRIHPADSNSSERQKAVAETYRFLMADLSLDKIRSDVYYDEISKRIMGSYRLPFFTTAKDLLAIGDTAKARNLLLKCYSELPPSILPYGSTQNEFIALLYSSGLKVQAYKLSQDFIQENLEFLRFTKKLNSFQKKYVNTEKELALQNLNRLVIILDKNEEYKQASELEQAIAKCQ